MNDTPPLLEVGLELAAPERIVWQPEIGQNGRGSGVRDLFNGWIKGFLHHNGCSRVVLYRRYHDGCRCCEYSR